MNSHPSEIEAVLRGSELLDELASIEHQRWSHWQQYLHDQCEELEDGSLKIPADLVDHWTTQIQTPFHELTDKEKQSDRDQVLDYLPTIAKALLGQASTWDQADER